MQHKELAATVLETDQGVFSAIAAAYSVDRANERIHPGAFKDTLSRWQSSGKRIPVHWNHEASAENIIGAIDPIATAETDQGLRVEGKLDLEDSTVARDAWRAMKNDAVALSFGYLVKRSHRDDGVEVLDELDLFEISIVPAPANQDTRILSMKSAGSEVDQIAAMSADELLVKLGFGEKAKPSVKKAEPVQIATFEV